MNTAKVTSFRQLEVYKMAFSLQQEIFQLSRSFPTDETYSLTDQIRRSSRSVGANLAEAWAKRRYAASFLSKLSDSDGELQETAHWLDTSLACEYISPHQHLQLTDTTRSIGAMIGKMMSNHQSWCKAATA